MPSTISIIVALVLLAASFGSGWEVRKWKDDAALLAQRDAQLEAQRKAVEDAVALQVAEDAATLDVGKKVVEYRDRIVTKTITLTREVPKYVTPKAVAACVVPRGFIELHNISAAAAVSAAAVPDPASGPVDADSHVGIDTVASTIAANYGRCNQALMQNNVAWPEWYAKAKAAYDDWASKQARQR